MAKRGSDVDVGQDQTGNDDIGQKPRAIDGVGVRQAVEAARRAIFLVELIRAEHQRAHLAKECRRLAHGKRGLARLTAGWSEEKESLRFREQLSRVLAMVPAASIEDPDLRARWSSIQESCPQALEDDIDRELSSFIDDGTHAVVRWVEDALSLVWRNFAMLSGIALAILLVIAMEQIHALLFERWWYGPAALAALLPVPVLALVGHLLKSKTRARVPAWFADLVKVGFFWRPAARYPTGYDMLADNPRLSRRMTAAMVTRGALFLVWMWVAYRLFGMLSEGFEILMTLGQVTCLFGVLLGGLATLDLWDFVHPAPIRRLFLTLAIAIWAIYSWNDFSLAVVVACVVAVAISLGIAFLERPKVAWAPPTMAVGAVVLALGAMTYEEAAAQREAWKSPARVLGPDSPDRSIEFDEWPHPRPNPGGAPGAPEPPIVAMTASGGGSRAALLTIFALQELARTCTVRADPNPSAADDQEPRLPCEKARARPVAECLNDRLGDHLQAISSVSGGSLATAAYLASLLDREPRADLDDKMSDDFLQPVLDGALTQGTSRGENLERYWNRELGLDDRLSTIARRWREGLGERRPPLPLPIFNSATLDAHAVVLTPLNWKDQYQHDDEREAFEGKSLYLGNQDPTWIYYRWGVYSLADLLPGFDPTLAQAVRASANFPFGFPLVQVETDRRLAFSPREADREENKRKERVRLTDGGVVSNSGMWTLFRFLKAHAEVLKRRGLVLVMVDATRMPEYEGRTRTVDLVRAIFDDTPVAGNLHLTMLTLLRELLDDRFAVIELGMPPNRDSNFYTSWALDDRTRTKLASDAKKGVSEMARQAQLAFCELSHEKGKPKSTLARLPLD